MAELSMTIEDMADLMDRFWHTAQYFQEASDDLGKIIALVKADGLNGQVGEMILTSLTQLQDKLKKAATKFGAIGNALERVMVDLRKTDGVVSTSF